MRMCEVNNPIGESAGEPASVHCARRHSDRRRAEGSRDPLGRAKPAEWRMGNPAIVPSYKPTLPHILIVIILP